MLKTKNEIVMAIAKLNHSRPSGTPKIELLIIGGNIYGLDILKLDEDLQLYVAGTPERLARLKQIRDERDWEPSCFESCVLVYGQEIADKIKEYLNISNSY